MKRASVAVNIPVEEVDSDTKVVSHALKADNTVALQELLELLLDIGQGREEGLVVALVQAADEQGQGAEVDSHLSFGMVSACAQCGQIHSSGGRLGCLRANGVIGTWSSTESAAQS
ncbi:hypothetical protein HG531_005423 [Fusarium graminearum]|nr:hypothetical protein HG531_005423 [Fusarium graminearum]